MNQGGLGPVSGSCENIFLLMAISSGIIADKLFNSQLPYLLNEGGSVRDVGHL